MVYLISRSNCYIGKKIFSNVKYALTDIQNCPTQIIIGTSAVYINFYEVLNNCVNENVTKFCYEGDIYLILNCRAPCAQNSICFNEGGVNFSINTNKNLTIYADGNLLVERDAQDIKFSHHEAQNGYIYLYFNGKRDYVAILKDKTCIYADFYDEVNINNQEKLFLTRLNDSLNHGRVCKIDKSGNEIYLVYLDDAPLNLKLEFLTNVFLDCFKAKNLKYCNALLTEEIKQNDETLIQNFIDDFDYFIPIKQNVCALIKGNKLTNICQFEVCENKISNICFVN